LVADFSTAPVASQVVAISIRKHGLMEREREILETRVRLEVFGVMLGGWNSVV
jgi:hypothetical protein